MRDATLRYSDFIGNKFNRLTVISFSHSKKKHTYFKCICDCGKELTARRDCIIDGNTKSCGCLWKENCTNKTHGASHGEHYKPEYKVWTGMKQRCLNPNAYGYKYWGGRGISICERWLKFENFIQDMGQRPSEKHSIDRINNDGNYEPSNCRWATRDEQRKNQRKRGTAS